MLRGFITNLSKYTEGELIGEWIEFPIAESDLDEVLERIGIDEQYEDFFFTDWESDYDGLLCYFGEYPSIDDVNEIAEYIGGLSMFEEITFRNACEVWNVSEVLESDINDFILYDASSDYDLGYYWIEESGCYNTKELGSFVNYIDYEAFGRDLRLESNGGFCSYGYIERV